MSQSRYESLDSGRREIRVIEILSPGTETSPAECRLKTVSLLEDISFTALSYVWGDPTVTRNIILDGSTVSVTSNLADALGCVKQHWQQQYPDRDPQSFRLWVDAICIDQEDVKERNQQLQLMRSIFSEAELVLSWLGSGSEEMCLALRTFAVIAQEVKHISETDLSLDWMEKHPSLCVQDMDPGDDGIGNQAWTAMWHFFDLTYWYRVWIFQELVLGRNVLLISTSESLRYESLAVVCAWSRRVQEEAPTDLYQLQRPPAVSDAAWRAATGPYLDWYMINKITLAKKKRHNSTRRWNFLLICRDLLATDPKDHIYGLLGILEEGLEAKIIPNYEKAVGDVYSETIGYWIEEEQDLGFLYLAGLGRFRYEPDLPSWVPRFRKASETPGRWYITTGNADWGVFEDSDDRAAVSDSTLEVVGLKIDTITAIQEAPMLATWNDGRMLQYCIDYISRTSVYVTGVPPLQAIFHVLMMRHEYREEPYLEEEYPEGEASAEESPQEEISGERRSKEKVSRKEDVEDSENAKDTKDSENIEDAEDRASEAAEQERSNNERYYHLLAMGFLKYVLFSSEINVKPQDRFKLLGLSSGDEFPQSFERVVFPHCEFLKNRLPNLSIELTRREGPLTDATRNVMTQIVRYKDAFRFIETLSGYLGLVPDGAVVGDTICVLKDCKTPIVVRKIDDHYIHIGTCFVLGLMEGESAEILKSGKVNIQRFKIR